MFVLGCASPCQFLGSAESVPRRVEPETQPMFDKPTLNKEKTEVDKAEITQAVWCSSCNEEMNQGRTKFRIDGLERTSRKTIEKELSAIVYLCPKCGKIEFKADKT
jgi:predicted RNA-binding Zn-ribbon protein involved in translation (DUF1610 family)